MAGKKSADITDKTTPESGDLFSLRDNGDGLLRDMDYDDLKASISGKTPIPMRASEFTPASNSGCAALATAAGASVAAPDLHYLAFDDSTLEAANIFIPMPKAWNEGTITAKFLWTANTTSTDAANWLLRARAFGDGDVLTDTVSTVASATDAHNGTAKDLNISAEISALSIDGSPQEGDLLWLQVLRNASAGVDTLTGDAWLLAVVLYITTDAPTDD